MTLDPQTELATDEGSKVGGGRLCAKPLLGGLSQMRAGKVNAAEMSGPLNVKVTDVQRPPCLRF